MAQGSDGSRSSSGGFRVGSWRVDPVACELRAEDRTVRLRPKVMDLLVALAARPGEVLRKQELLDVTWADVIVGENSFTVAVAELRKALGDDPARPAFLETIPRRGYRLVAPVEGVPPPPRPSPTPAPFSLIGCGVTIALRSGRTVLGRDAECDVQLDSQHASRFQAAVEVVGDRVFVHDLGSKNGTFVCNRRIEAATEMHPGDRVRFGRHGITLLLADAHSATWTDMSEAPATGGEETPV